MRKLQLEPGTEVLFLCLGVVFIVNTGVSGGTVWRGWLRYCDTSRKVVGSFPDGVIENFQGYSCRTMALGLTQPLTEVSTRNISLG